MGRLRSLPPRVGAASLAIVQTPPKQADTFYASPEWAALRRATLERDGYRCQIRGPQCTGVASIADHIVSRRNGGADALSNLRAACKSCDSSVKEDHVGVRRWPKGLNRDSPKVE